MGAISAAVIRMNYRQSIAQAKKLSDAAEDLRRLANSDLNSSLEGVRGAWTGDNANIFLQKGNDLKQKMLTMAKNMDSTARTIRSIAQRIYDAEMSNLGLIH